MAAGRAGGVGPPVLVLLLCLLAAGPADPPTGDAVIRGKAGPSEVVVTTTARLAGAVHSLTWDGKEFIDSADHGRQLQSAASLGDPKGFWAEAYNPTEAGSRDDGAGPRSTSRLLHLVATPDSLQTTTRMAFWLKPGQDSSGHPARNTTPLSDHLVTKRVRVGYKTLPHVLPYDVTFSVPVSERHRLAQFEVVTGYMPAEFERFWAFDAGSGELEPLSDGPGEQARPVVLATASGGHAMGCYLPPQPRPGHDPVRYGRWRFGPEKVVKWNAVVRVRDAAGVGPGDFAFRGFVAVGDLPAVRGALRALHAEFGGR